jgi:hypothetical protein
LIIKIIKQFIGGLFNNNQDISIPLFFQPATDGGSPARSSLFLGDAQLFFFFFWSNDWSYPVKFGGGGECSFYIAVKFLFLIMED